MKYKIINTDLMIKRKLYNENSHIKLDSIPEGLEQLLVPVNNPIPEIPLNQEPVLNPIQETEQKPEIISNKSKRGRIKSSHV